MRWVLFLLIILFGCNKPEKHSVITPNIPKLPYTIEDGVKVFQLTAEPVKQEFAPGLVVNCWGYNGSTPGPTIEAVEGDRVRILVTNHLPEPTTVHWHGILVPNGMDGVTGLNQAPIPSGETFKYEFTLKQHGTYMYHAHLDEMVQIGMGLVGFFIIHPKEPKNPPIDRDFAIMLQEWYIPAGSATPDPMVMLDFNYFTFNGHIYPGTAPLVVKKGERVRIRLANLSMDNHPIHLHGFAFTVTGSGGWTLPKSAQYLGNTIDVVVGNTHDIEFVADEPGDWALHCHKTHHVMSGMEHGIPNMIGANQGKLPQSIEKFLPDYMPMGTTGMWEMFEMSHHMPRPRNFLPFGSPGQFGLIDMSGMFTILKVRDGITNYNDPGWYANPPGTVAESVSGSKASPMEMSKEHMNMQMGKEMPQQPKELPHKHEGDAGLKIGDFHPVLLHFPIVLLFTALVFDFLFLIGKVKDPSIAHWFVIVAAALAIPTVITGLYAAEQEHAGHSNILLHRNWALVTLAYSLGHAIFRTYLIKSKKLIPAYILVVISLINVGLVGITAEYGGTITRGKGILIRSSDQKLDSKEDSKGLNDRNTH
ncbi:MAG: multicopper oxidase domain-containing protein [Chlamydiales bacterium]|nr:multicopper oxidase domain-containing protein [Chlamydiales bacterium]